MTLEDHPAQRPECTRHFVATVYVVHDGATALHQHDRLGLWLPPGGHLGRDELPHEAAVREVDEELGLPVELVTPVGDVSSGTVRSLPEPHHLLLEDIDALDGRVVHQHVDFVYYGAVSSREFAPGRDEAPATAWEWFTADELCAAGDRLEPDVIQVGVDAIETVEAATPR